MAIKISLEELVKAGAHFGHQTRRWNPKMEPFIHGAHDGVHVFDLTKTKEMLENVLKILKSASKDKKTILFVGTKKQAKEKIKQVAKKTKSLCVTERWLGGTLTNFDQIKKSTSKLSEMKDKMKKGDYKSLTKKERLLKEREIERLTRFFGGIENIDEKPDILVVVDIRREKGAVQEANVVGIPVIAIVDSNCDPDLVDYQIPMNDDATRAIEYVLDLMKEAILEGKKKIGKKAKK